MPEDSNDNGQNGNDGNDDGGDDDNDDGHSYGPQGGNADMNVDDNADNAGIDQEMHEDESVHMDVSENDAQMSKTVEVQLSENECGNSGKTLEMVASDGEKDDATSKYSVHEVSEDELNAAIKLSMGKFSVGGDYISVDDYIVNEGMDDNAKMEVETGVKKEEVKVVKELKTYKAGRKKKLARKSPKSKKSTTVDTPTVSGSPTTVNNNSVKTPVTSAEVTSPATVINQPTTAESNPTTVNPTTVNTSITQQPTTVQSTTTVISTPATTITTTRVKELPVKIKEPTLPPKPESKLPKIHPKDKGKGVLEGELKLKEFREPHLESGDVYRNQVESTEREMRRAAEMGAQNERPVVDITLDDQSVVAVTKEGEQVYKEMTAKGLKLSAQKVHDYLKKKTATHSEELTPGFALLKRANEEKARKARMEIVARKKSKPLPSKERRKYMVTALQDRYAPAVMVKGWDMKKLEQEYNRHMGYDEEWNKKIANDKFLNDLIKENKAKADKELKQALKDAEDQREKDEEVAKAKALQKEKDEQSRVQWASKMSTDRQIPDLEHDREALSKLMMSYSDHKEITHSEVVPSSRIVEWEGVLRNIDGTKREEIKVVRASGFTDHFRTFAELLRRYTREDLIDLHRLINFKDRVHSEIGLERVWDEYLRSMFEPDLWFDLFWYNRSEVYNWRYFARVGVHMVQFRNYKELYMLDNRIYVLGTQVLQRMINFKLRSKVINEGAFKVLYMVANQLHKRNEAERLARLQNQAKKDDPKAKKKN